MKKKSIITIILGFILGGSSLLGLTHTSQAQNKVELEKISQDTPIYLELASDDIQNNTISQLPQSHYSHVSHQSHYSHRSHQSHYSHYSSI